MEGVGLCASSVVLSGCARSTVNRRGGRRRRAGFQAEHGDVACWRSKRESIHRAGHFIHFRGRLADSP
eukprot:4806154-Amphidinium_carterae.1